MSGPFGIDGSTGWLTLLVEITLDGPGGGSALVLAGLVADGPDILTIGSSSTGQLTGIASCVGWQTDAFPSSSARLSPRSGAFILADGLCYV